MELLVWVSVNQDRGGTNDSLQCVKHMLLSGSPFPWGIVLCEVMEGLCHLGEVLDELAVKIAEPNELSDGSDVSGWFPILYGFHFYSFHFEPVGRQFHA